MSVHLVTNTSANTILLTNKRFKKDRKSSSCNKPICGSVELHGEVMRLILIVVLFLLLLGALPAWPYSTAWGYYPSGGLGLLLIIVLVLLLANRRSVP
jgi:hypothetical protein